MSDIAPEPSTSRGGIALQPSYFTSSLYVEPLRDDITTLIALFSERYCQQTKPFEFFKTLWTEQGWCWLHLKVHDGRARQAFLRTTERLFLERIADTENVLAQIVALFALYTFHTTQPSTSAPSIYSIANIDVPIDTYEAMVLLPSILKASSLSPLRPYVTHILNTLLDAQAFHIGPHSSLNAQNPSRLPREIFIPEGQDSSAVLQAAGVAETTQQASGGVLPRKKGRPSKRDKARKAKEALAALEKYVDRNTVTPAGHIPPGPDAFVPRPGCTHAVFGQAPHASLNSYLTRKNDILATVYAEEGANSANVSGSPSKAALQRANEAVLTRLKQIDRMAAEKGLEVGGEGGEKTGLGRVEKAVQELQQGSGIGATGGMLRLLEGAGIDMEN